MRIRVAVAIAFLVAGLTAPIAVHAAPVNLQVPVHAMFAKSKIVKLALRNETGIAMELKVGEQVMSLDPGKTIALKLAVGTRVVVNTPAPRHPVGELIAEASSEFNNTTLVLK